MEQTQHKWYGSVNGMFKIPIGEETSRLVGNIPPENFKDANPKHKYFVNLETLNTRFSTTQYPDMGMKDTDAGYRRVEKDEFLYRQWLTYHYLNDDTYLMWIHPKTGRSTMEDNIAQEEEEQVNAYITKHVMEKENYKVLNAKVNKHNGEHHTFVFSNLDGEWLIDPALGQDEDIMNEWKFYQQLVN